MTKHGIAPVTRFRRVYGSSPLHLLMMALAFAALVSVLSTLSISALWAGEVWWQTIIVWFLGAIILHDFVLFPLYSVADTSLPAMLRGARQRIRPHTAKVSPQNYIRIPLMITALLFLLFFPGIIAQGAETFSAATGLTQAPYLQRFAILTAVVFVISGLAYGVAMMRARRAPSPVEAENRLRDNSSPESPS